MNTTTILEPFDVKNSELDAELKPLYAKYYSVLREILCETADKYKNDIKQEKEEITLDDLLKLLADRLGLKDDEITLDDYYMMLRTTCKSTTVFLKRTCRELMLNQYNRSIVLRHRANMDIQHVTDPYGIAVYVSAYLTESNKHMSATLKRAYKEIFSGNESVRKKLHRVATTFQNGSEMGAQEAVYHLLSTPVCKSSRQIVFINTYRSKDRHLMIKEARYLERMNPNSTDIYRTGLLDQYKMRNKKPPFQNMCLAIYASQWRYISIQAYKNLTKKKEERNPPGVSLKDFYDNFDEDYFLENSDDDIELNEIDLRGGKKTPEDLGFTRQADKGYVKERENYRIIRYKRYSKIKDEVNWKRVELMLFYPWRDEVHELENDENAAKIYEKNISTILLNKKIFESKIGEDFELLQEQVERELEEHYQQLNASNIEREHEVRNYLLNNNFTEPEETNDINPLDSVLRRDREELEDEYGYQAAIHHFNDIARDEVERENEIRMPDRWSSDK